MIEGEATETDGTFTITIETGNAAFEDNLGAALARLLRVVADRLYRYGPPETPRTIHDGNGNDVGFYEWAARE